MSNTHETNNNNNKSITEISELHMDILYMRQYETSYDTQVVCMLMSMHNILLKYVNIRHACLTNLLTGMVVERGRPCDCGLSTKRQNILLLTPVLMVWWCSSAANNEKSNLCTWAYCRAYCRTHYRWALKSKRRIQRGLQIEFEKETWNLRCCTLYPVLCIKYNTRIRYLRSARCFPHREWRSALEINSSTWACAKIFFSTF